MEAAKLAGELLSRLDRDISPAAREALHSCERICTERGLGLFLVGGAVRDLLLDRSHVDLDLAVEADPAEIAAGLAATLAGKAVRHERFGTANVSGPGFHLDLAQTRRETYTHPGALPAVEPVTSILDDLSRRDFSINAIALRLTPNAGIIDPFGGSADLGAGLVRVLHEDSFRDDATRMLRAVRYATRLDFRLETLTQIWLQRDLEFLDAVSGPRLRRELALIFEAAEAADATLLATRLGILSAVHSDLHLEPGLAGRWREALAGRHFGPLDELGFCLVSKPERDDEVESVSRRLHLLGRVEKALRHLVRLRGASDKLAFGTGSPSTAVELLDSTAKAAVWAWSLLDVGPAGRACAAFLEDWQHVRPALSGNDLLALGVPAGVQLGAMLRQLRRARLEGEISSRDDELCFVRSDLGNRAGG